jgi:hypothetical protein
VCLQYGEFHRFIESNVLSSFAPQQVMGTPAPLSCHMPSTVHVGYRYYSCCIIICICAYCRCSLWPGKNGMMQTNLWHWSVRFFSASRSLARLTLLSSMQDLRRFVHGISIVTRDHAEAGAEASAEHSRRRQLFAAEDSEYAALSSLCLLPAETAGGGRMDLLRSWAQVSVRAQGRTTYCRSYHRRVVPTQVAQ